MTKRAEDPSPEEIRAACEEIRKDWSPLREYRSRGGLASKHQMIEDDTGALQACTTAQDVVVWMREVDHDIIYDGRYAGFIGPAFEAREE